VRPHPANHCAISLVKTFLESEIQFVLCVNQTIESIFKKQLFRKMYGNIVPLTTVGAAQVLPGNVIPTNTVGNNDLVIIQDTTTATSQAELINQLQNHITENQQILIITDDQGQDQCKFYFICLFFFCFKFILTLF